MEIKEYQDKVDQWIKTVGVKYFSELTNMAILTEEVGELARYISRIYGEQSFKRKEDEKNAKDKMADEMADVLWVLVCLANQTGIDLEDAIKRNIEKKTKRDNTRHKENKKLS